MKTSRILKIGALALCAALIAAMPSTRGAAGRATHGQAPQTFHVSLFGLFNVRSGQNCEWDGGGEEGVQPYTYRWTIHSSQFGYIDPFGGYTDIDVLDYYVAENNGSWIDITFEAWDANGAYASITKRVTVGSGGAGCVA